MKNYIGVLKRTQLFSGVREDELHDMLECLQAKLFTFKKGEYVFKQGEYIDQITVLVEGKLLIQRDDFWGNRSIISVIKAGEMFGEVHIAPKNRFLLNDVVAEEDSAVVYIDAQKILTTCSSVCKFHSIVIQNLFYTISEKNQRLVQKIRHMSNRTIRTKLLSYLSEEAQKQNSNNFIIPFNRQQLADFLCVDRSAMSNELCKMRDEGLIQFEKNEFTLK